jgi:ribosomal RNA assembly protein
METIYVSRIREVMKKKAKLQRELKVKILIRGKIVEFDGDALEEYEAQMVFDAINFGFSVELALQLKDDEMKFQKIKIRDHTRRKNLKDVCSRIIGRMGTTRKTIEEISGCRVKIKDNEVGVIGESDSVENAINAIIHIIKGSKQSNMYQYLERMNRVRKELE